MKVGENQPFRTERRKGVAWCLIGTANLLQTIHDANLREFTGEYDYNLCTERERQVIEKCKRMLRWQIKAMNAVAKSMGVKNNSYYGD